MSTKREFLKQLVGLAVAPLVPVPDALPAAPVVTPLLPKYSFVDEVAHWVVVKSRQKGASLSMMMQLEKQKRIEAAKALGHEGPWTWCYQLEPGHETPRYERCLLDGKGVVCG